MLPVPGLRAASREQRAQDRNGAQDEHSQMPFRAVCGHRRVAPCLQLHRQQGHQMRPTAGLPTRSP